jgi:predicted nucleic-acid-binding protein
MTRSAFLATNVLLRHILQDQPDQSSRATALFHKAGSGEVSLYAADSVIFEAVYILSKQFGATRHEIAESLQEALDIPAFIVSNRDALQSALTFWTPHGGLSFVDCFHLAMAAQLGLDHIYTFGQKMDRYPGVSQIEP